MAKTNHSERVEALEGLPDDVREQIERYQYLSSLPLKALTLYPKARDDEAIVVQDVLSEYIIYDLHRHQVHSLNATAAMVWQWCDGVTQPMAMVSRLAHRLDVTPEQAEPLVWLALDRLETAKLLVAKVARPVAYADITRRQVLRVVTAGLVPVVYSIIAPTSSAAQSLGGACTTEAQCGCVVTQQGNFQICCTGGTCAPGTCVNTGDVTRNANQLCSFLCGAPGNSRTACP